jgi:hypothetical protein
MREILSPPDRESTSCRWRSSALKIAYATQGRRQYRDVFYLVRGARRFLNLQVRLGDTLGVGQVRPSLRALKSYWQSGSKQG